MLILMIMVVDYVFPWVNPEDINWQQELMIESRKINRMYEPYGARYRSWGTLKYLLRCINNNLPWIRNLYMIVESPSQVPDWINTDKVHIIYHKDIIPLNCLPTFNSCTIELYMSKIPGLSEHFIYGNDDMFPISPFEISDFFTKEGIPKQSMTFDIFNNKSNMFANQLKNTGELAAKELKINIKDGYILRPQHGINGMLKSTWKIFLKKYKKELENSCTPFRTIDNINQDLCQDYIYMLYKDNKEVNNRNYKFSYWDFKNFILEDLQKDFNDNDIKMLCINDSRLATPDALAKAIFLVNNMFENKFKNPSIYENKIHK